MQAFDIIFCCFTSLNHMLLQKAAVLTAEGYVFAQEVPQSLLKDRDETLFDFFTVTYFK